MKRTIIRQEKAFFGRNLSCEIFSDTCLLKFFDKQLIEDESAPDMLLFPCQHQRLKKMCLKIQSIENVLLHYWM